MKCLKFYDKWSKTPHLRPYERGSLLTSHDVDEMREGNRKCICDETNALVLSQIHYNDELVIDAYFIDGKVVKTSERANDIYL